MRSPVMVWLAFKSVAKTESDSSLLGTSLGRTERRLFAPLRMTQPPRLPATAQNKRRHSGRSDESLFGWRPGKPYRDRIPLLANRQLLGHAVDGAKSEHQIAAINRNNLTIRKKFCKRVQGNAIVRIAEDRDEYEFVGNVEVSIARGQALTMEENRRRHRKRFDAKPLSVLIIRRVEQRKILL